MAGALYYYNSHFKATLLNITANLPRAAQLRAAVPCLSACHGPVSHSLTHSIRDVQLSFWRSSKWACSPLHSNCSCSHAFSILLHCHHLRVLSFCPTLHVSLLLPLQMSLHLPHLGASRAISTCSTSLAGTMQHHHYHVPCGSSSAPTLVPWCLGNPRFFPLHVHCYSLITQGHLPSIQCYYGKRQIHQYSTNLSTISSSWIGGKTFL